MIPVTEQQRSSVSPVTILTVLVLYCMKPEESLAFSSLRTLLTENASLARHLNCVVYDNSPQPHSLPPTPFPCLYHHNPNNPGLAVPYQNGLDRALDAHIPWLLLLDQDTQITAEYLLEILTLIQQFGSDSHIVAVVPKLLHGELMLSPHWPNRHPNPEPLDQKAGILEQKMKIFNSGSLLRVTAIAEIGGFPQNYPLDYLDHAAFHLLQNLGGRAYLMHAGLQHSLSCLQVDLVRQFRSSYRTRLTMNAESRYYKQFGTTQERILYVLRRSRLGLRMIRAGELRNAASLLRHTLDLAHVDPDRFAHKQ